MLYIEEYLNYLKFEKRFSKYTIVSYETDLKQFSEFLIQEFTVDKPSDVSHKMVRQWIVSLLENQNVARSVNRKLSALKSFYKFLLKHNFTKENPLEKIISPKANKRLPVFMGESQMNALIDKVEFGEDFNGQRNCLIIETFYFTGMRLSELINLKVENIDFHNLLIRVIGKRNKERIIPITKEFALELQAFCNSFHLEIFVFTNEKGSKLYPMAVQRIVRSYLQLVTSHEKKSPHVIRHTFATHMLNNGADLNSIKELLGHANLSATQVYTHNTFEKLKKIYKQSHPRA